MVERIAIAMAAGKPRAMRYTFRVDASYDKKRKVWALASIRRNLILQVGNHP